MIIVVGHRIALARQLVDRAPIWRRPPASASALLLYAPLPIAFSAEQRKKGSTSVAEEEDSPPTREYI